MNTQEESNLITNIEDLSAFYKEQMPGNSLLYTADELSSYLTSLDDKFALSTDVSSKTELYDKFLAISKHLPANLTVTAEANTFLYSPTDNVADIAWKKYIPEPTADSKSCYLQITDNNGTLAWNRVLPEPSVDLKSYYLQLTDDNGTLAWTKVKALPDETKATEGLVLTSHGKEDSASWEAYSVISRSVGDIFYTTRTDVLANTGQMLNGAVPCNGKTWTGMSETPNGIIDLLRKGVLPYVSTAEYANILITQNGVCHLFGWDGGTNVIVPKLNDVFIEASISNDNNGYLEAGIPNIAGLFSGVGQKYNTSVGSAAVSGAIYIANKTNSPTEGVRLTNATGDTQRDDVFGFSAVSGEIKTDGTLKTSNEDHVYGKSDTVQPRAVRYIPMVQLCNSVNEEAIVKYDDIMNSIQAGHMLGEVFYTTRLDTVDSNTSAHMINGAVACNGQIRYCSVNIPAKNEIPVENETDRTEEYNKYLSNTIPGLLKLGKLPYVALDDYDDIISVYGVCRCFGWDGNKDTEINSDVFRKYRVPKLDKVFIEAGLNASDVSGGQYIGAGIPNIIGGFSRLAAGGADPWFGAFSVSCYDDPALSHGGTQDSNNAKYAEFNALSGETNVNGELKSKDEYHVYGKSDTVQPPAVCYVPMVQIVNKVEVSKIDEYSHLQNQITQISGLIVEIANTLNSNV